MKTITIEVGGVVVSKGVNELVKKLQVNAVPLYSVILFFEDFKEINFRLTFLMSSNCCFFSNNHESKAFNCPHAYSQMCGFFV